MEIMIHPRVKKYILGTGEKERIKESLKKLVEDPYNKLNGLDIKKMRGKNNDMYRLRVGDHRFEYFIEDNRIWVDEGFIRGRGYR
ncbi:MAG: type II toxin-antitoxin system RelE/ParE family toxin [Thermoplasmatota archaeon]